MAHYEKTNKGWAFRIDIGKDLDGKRKQKWFRGYRTKKEAEQACAKITTDITRGIFIKPSSKMLGEYLLEWIEAHKMNIAEATYRSYKVNINKHINPNIGAIPLQNLNPMQIKQLYTKLLKTDENKNKRLSPASVKYIHTTLRKALNDAVSMQIIPNNPLQMVNAPKVRKYNSVFLTEQQIEKMLNLMEGEDIYLPTLLAVSLGLRRGEVLGLMWDDIDFEKQLVTIKRSYSPTDKGYIFKELKTESSKRVIGLPESITDYLKQILREQKLNKLFFGEGYTNLGLVCCKENGEPISPSVWNKKYRQAMDSLGMTAVRIHDLRHTNASLMLKHGVPMKVASERLGHKTIGITMDLYSHVDESLQKDAADRLNGVFNLACATNVQD